MSNTIYRTTPSHGIAPRGRQHKLPTEYRDKQGQEVVLEAGKLYKLPSDVAEKCLKQGVIRAVQDAEKEEGHKFSVKGWETVDLSKIKAVARPAPSNATIQDGENAALAAENERLRSENAALQQAQETK